MLAPDTDPRRVLAYWTLGLRPGLCDEALLAELEAADERLAAR